MPFIPLIVIHLIVHSLKPILITQIATRIYAEHVCKWHVYALCRYLNRIDTKKCYAKNECKHLNLNLKFSIARAIHWRESHSNHESSSVFHVFRVNIYFHWIHAQSQWLLPILVSKNRDFFSLTQIQIRRLHDFLLVCARITRTASIWNVGKKESLHSSFAFVDCKLNVGLFLIK